MARTGISLTQVKNARANLLARNHPVSIDAIRIELGNTGSKTTISRHLNELVAQDKRQHDTLGALSDELGLLVGNIAERLKAEAEAIVEEKEAKHHEAQKAWQQERDSLSQELAQTQTQVETLIARLSEQEKTEAEQRLQLTALQLELGKATEKEHGLKAQLDEKQAHIQSLEQKHTHAREALAHFRESAKQQREQEQQRHEHQVQQIQAEQRQTHQHVMAVQTTLQNKEHDVVRLDTALTNTMEQLDQCRQALELSELQHEQLSKEHIQLQQELSKKCEADEAQQTHQAVLNAKIESSEKLLNQLSRETLSLQAKLEAKEQVLQQLLAITGRPQDKGADLAGNRSGR